MKQKEKQTMDDVAWNVAVAIGRDISDRRGLRQEFERIDVDVVNLEIYPTWSNIVKKHVKKYLKSQKENAKNVPPKTKITCCNCDNVYDFAYTEPFGKHGDRICVDCIEGLGKEDLPVGVN